MRSTNERCGAEIAERGGEGRHEVGGAVQRLARPRAVPGLAATACEGEPGNRGAWIAFGRALTPSTTIV